MVSYYNTALYSQKHSAANLAYPAGQWQWPANYHTTSNHQFLGDMDSPHAAHHQMYYNPHVFHTAAGAAAAAASEWHSPSSSDNYPQNAPSAHQMIQQHHPHHHPNGSGSGGGGAGTPSSASSGSSSSIAAGSNNNGNGNGSQLNDSGSSSIGEQQQQQQQQQHNIIAEGLPSPPITVSGSEISSPGVPVSSSSPHHIPHHLNNSNNSPSTNNNNNNTTAHNNNNNSLNHSSGVKPAQYGNSIQYDWMKKPAYPAQPTPGKTRTKDKYRVVYTDYQRLELEKEYCTSRYITIRRKTELATTLSLSERQVKIWFQNRRAKERKQNKKGSDLPGNAMAGIGVPQHSDYANLMVDTKPKLEPGLQHLQHSLHSMSSMAAMSMPTMSHLHHHLHPHHPLAVSAAAAHTHQLHQSQMSQMSAAAAASVGSLTM